MTEYPAEQDYICDPQLFLRRINPHETGYRDQKPKEESFNPEIDPPSARNRAQVVALDSMVRH